MPFFVTNNTSKIAFSSPFKSVIVVRSAPPKTIVGWKYKSFIFFLDSEYFLHILFPLFNGKFLFNNRNALFTDFFS
jgi:hypothetical protein